MLQKEINSKPNPLQIVPVAERHRKLIALQGVIEKREMDILDALHADFGKSPFESVASEWGIVLSELRYFIKNIKRWSVPHRVRSSILNFPSRAYIYREPYGHVLVIGPWNYPFLLTMQPVIGAFAAGNTVTLKPSELATHTGKVVEEIIRSVFNESEVEVVQGGVEVASELLSRRWDLIFFTGSVKVGKIVAKAAAEYLTPTILELGGKNPCIINADVNVKLVARRLVWGKFFNGGQTCIAPDYLLVHRAVKEQIVEAFREEIAAAYTDNPGESPDFPRIINRRNFDRLVQLLEGQQILIGGDYRTEDLYIAPTLVDEPSLDSPLMADEIFGPILPVLSYETEADIERIIGRYERPLSLYVFSKSIDFSERMIRRYSFGGGVVNDTLVYFANEHLPFGGIGNSGMGRYHGVHTFEAFTHEKPVVWRGNWLDIPVRYAPYKGKLKWLKFFLRF